jgi:hypothetical protein
MNGQRPPSAHAARYAPADLRAPDPVRMKQATALPQVRTFACLVPQNTCVGCQIVLMCQRGGRCCAQRRRQLDFHARAVRAVHACCAKLPGPLADLEGPTDTSGRLCVPLCAVPLCRRQRSPDAQTPAAAARRAVVAADTRRAGAPCTAQPQPPATTHTARQVGLPHGPQGEAAPQRAASQARSTARRAGGCCCGDPAAGAAAAASPAPAAHAAAQGVEGRRPARCTVNVALNSSSRCPSR